MERAERAELRRAAELIAHSKKMLAFTGAGISRESGVPTFRGEGGLWEKIDPGVLEISRFNRDPEGCWRAIRELFYRASPRPVPNAAHRVLAEWEARGILSFLVTQNIDGLHREAGSRRIAEFHGSLAALVCTRCGERVEVRVEALDAGLLDHLPPRCSAPRGDTPREALPDAEPDSAGSPEGPGSLCGAVLKPDFVFFGEGIPREAYSAAYAAAQEADLCLIIGSTGVVYPAAEIPVLVKQNGGAIIEIDPSATEFTSTVSDLHLAMGAVEALTLLDGLLRG